MTNGYVGAVPTTGDFKLLDSITTSSATTFNLRQGGVAVYPQSANHCLVVLNGVLQTAGSSFNIVNDTIVFASSLSSSDVINQILVLGNVNDIGVPSDDTVSTAKIQADAINATKIADDSISDEHLDITAITGQTAITSLADTDKFLVSDASDSGNLKYVEKQYLPSGGLVLIENQTITSAMTTIDFTSKFSSTYKNYMVVFSQVYASATAETQFQFKVGSTAQTSDSSGNDYNWVNEGRHINNGDNDGQQAGTNSFRIHGDNNSYQDTDVSFTMMIFNPLIARKKRVIAEGVFTNASQYLVTFNMSGEHSSTATNFDGFRFLRSSSGFYGDSSSNTIGNVALYGLVN